MSRTIQIVNEYPGILDLSIVKDVVNKPVVLQPKGQGGSSRECFAEAADHPSVLVMKKAGRVSIRGAAPVAAAPTLAPVKLVPAPVVTPAPVPVPAPVPLEAAPPPPVPEPAPAPLAATPEPPAEEVPIEEIPVEEAPAEVIPMAAMEEVSAPSESRRGGKSRRG